MTSYDLSLIGRRYAEAFGAEIEPGFEDYFYQPAHDSTLALLGYMRAGHGELFLERYLDAPVERLIERRFGCEVRRDAIVELGNMASCNGHALINLWSQAANDLGNEMEFAVATLTAPLRHMFGRIGVPIHSLAKASKERAGGAQWGSYYDQDPQVCVGRIAEGQAAIQRFVSRRQKTKAA